MLASLVRMPCAHAVYARVHAHTCIGASMFTPLFYSLQTQKLAGAVGLGAGGAVAFYTTAPVETQFNMISALGPAFRLLDPETTHNLGIEAAKYGLFPKETRPDPAVLRSTVWAREFKNPIGRECVCVCVCACVCVCVHLRPCGWERCVHLHLSVSPKRQPFMNKVVLPNHIRA
jgi:hypothetical protein